MSRALALLAALRLRPRARWRTLRWGLYYRHPLCCVLRFALDPWGAQGYRRGGCFRPRSGWFVPCGIWHHHDPGSPGGPEAFGHAYEPCPFERDTPFRRANLPLGLRRSAWERPLWR